MEREKLIQLVTDAQQGKPEAGGALYEAFYQDVYYYILKIVDNQPELAEDLTQETFIEILQTIGKLQEPAAFVTWSRQVAYHRCTAYFRKRTELLADEDEDGYSVFDTMEEDRAEFIPGELLDQEAFKETIHQMLMELPAEQRSALFLRYFDEISVKEIAQIQGVTEGTVKSRLNYGRNAIRKAVEDYEKKHDIKLHSVAILPLILWLFRKYRLAQGVCAAGEAVAAAGAATAVAGTAGATSATATTAGTAASVGVKAGISVGVKKLVAGVVAAAVVGGGVTTAVVVSNDGTEPAPTTQQVIQNTTMAWSGFGGIYFAGNLERQLEITVTEMSDTYIKGYLKATLHGETEHESAFEGVGTAQGEDICYQLTYETPEQIRQPGYAGGIGTYETDVLIYDQTTQVFRFDGAQNESGLYSAVLMRIDPSQNLPMILSEKQFVGQTGTKAYTLTVETMTEKEIQGTLTVTQNGRVLHTTVFSGDGYLHGQGIYRYDLCFEPPGKDAFGGELKGIWLRYESATGQMITEGYYQANLIPET